MSLIRNAGVQGMKLMPMVEAIRMMGHEISFLVTGEPGIAKSAMHHIIKAQDEKQEADHIYLDSTNREPADMSMYIPEKDGRKLTQRLTELLKPDSPKPKVIMIDEYGKGTTMWKQAMAATLNERRVGDYQLTPGSIVFATTNNTGDGVGDTLAAHQTSRVTKVRLLKPSVAELCSYFADRNVDALLRTWIQLNPNCLDSYEDLDEDELNRNPYIFNPRKKAMQFVCPRTLERSNSIIARRNLLSDDAVHTMLSGTCGAAFAQNFMTFQTFEKYIHTPAQIIASPDSISIPDNDAALWHMMNKGIDAIKTQQDMSAYMVYVARFPRLEHQGIFFSMVGHSNKTKSVAANNNEFKKWALKNFEVMI